MNARALWSADLLSPELGGIRPWELSGFTLRELEEVRARQGEIERLRREAGLG